MACVSAGRRLGFVGTIVVSYMEVKVDLRLRISEEEKAPEDLVKVAQRIHFKWLLLHCLLQLQIVSLFHVQD